MPGCRYNRWDDWADGHALSRCHWFVPDWNAVTGATVDNIHYTLDSDPSKIASVVFTTHDPIAGDTASVVLKKSDDTVLDKDTCTVAGSTATCTLSTPVLINDLAKTALTVVQ